MAKRKPAKKSSATKKTVATITHPDDRRTNIPTAELESVMTEKTKTPIKLKYPRNTDLDPQLVWRGKDVQDWSDLVVGAPPLYIQEKVHPKVLIDDLLRSGEWQGASGKSEGTSHKSQVTYHQLDLFGDFNGLPDEARSTEFYQHEANWTNRMILGDSLQVMASLAEREGLRGKVQCIYFDPPYGIKFNSNFQWSTTSRDVKDGKADHITREPEQVKAFRDTWRDGIHSYLTYLRDRLTVARDLLTDSGSIFVQMNSENAHIVRNLLDEVFGESNFVADISFRKKSIPLGAKFLETMHDHILFYARNSEHLKFRHLFEENDVSQISSHGPYAMFPDGRSEKIDVADFRSPAHPKGTGYYRLFSLLAPSYSSNTVFKFNHEGRIFDAPSNGSWVVNEKKLRLLSAIGRLQPEGRSLSYRLFYDDFPYRKRTAQWGDSPVSYKKFYVVQTAEEAIARCILMATDPGDLVLDPTCGSGTTATVAEQWGRRWITIDTSRVALALARARIMGARYPYYLLADSPEGRQKEWLVTSGQWSEKAPEPLAPSHGNIRHGFVYERVPHITLKSIANNAEIDVIWDEHERRLAPLRQQLSELLTSHKALTTGHLLQEWEVPREAPSNWPPATQPLLTAFWKARIARQKEIDKSIAAKAEFEYLYDKPYVDKKTVRVAGPFTVESLSPHRILGVDHDDELIDPLRKSATLNVAERRLDYGHGVDDFVTVILENLKTSGVQQSAKEDKINFTTMSGWPGRFICAEGQYVKGDETGTEKRAGIFIGPEFGTVSRADLVAAAREAGDAGFDVLIACAFNYDARSSEFDKLGKIPVLKARMNADLHMADDLKNTGAGNLFVIFGEPDVEVVSGLWLVARNGRMVLNYERVKELSGAGSLEEINRLGGTDLSGFKELSNRREIRADQSNSKGGSVRAVKHRRGSSANRDGGVSELPEHGQRITGGGGNAVDGGPSSENAGGDSSRMPTSSVGGNQQNAWRIKTLVAIQTLTAADFPLSLTTSHFSQITINGVDVFKPNTGEVVSDSTDGIACWFIDTDYNEESFFVRHAYFLGASDPYKSLKTTLKAEINEEAWESLNSDTSRPFPKPATGRIAVKVINHLGDEVMKVFRV